MNIFIVALWWQMGGFRGFDYYETAKQACISAASDKAMGLTSHPFRAVMTLDGRITSMTPLRCSVSVEAK